MTAARPELTHAAAVAEAFEALVAALSRRRQAVGDPEPSALSVFQAVALRTLIAEGPLRLGALAETLGATDATVSRNLDVLEELGLAERRPDPVDARCVIVAATEAGARDVRRRRRQLERLAERALAGLSPDEARRVADALSELGALLDRR